VEADAQARLSTGRSVAGIVGACLALAVGGFFMWWALRQVDPAEVWNAIRGAHGGLLVAAVAVATSGFFLRALRWRVLLEPVSTGVGLGPLFAAVAVGFMVNNIFLWRLGEIARAFVLAKRSSVSFASSLGSLLAERVLDMLTLFVFLLVPLALASFPTDGVLATGTGGRLFRGGLAALGLAGLATALLVLFPRLVRGVVEVGVGFLGGGPLRDRVTGAILGALGDFLGAMSGLRSPGVLARATGWSFAIWGWSAYAFYLGMKSFGIDTGWVSALFTQATVGWFAAIPGPPGFVGNFHAAVKFALADTWGADPVGVLGLAFGLHLGGWIPITVIGLAYAARFGLVRRGGLQGLRSSRTEEARAEKKCGEDSPAGELSGGG